MKEGGHCWVKRRGALSVEFFESGSVALWCVGLLRTIGSYHIYVEVEAPLIASPATKCVALCKCRLVA